MTSPPAVTLRRAQEADVPAAAALLARALLAAPDRQLPGSCAALARSPYGVTQFAEVVTAARRRGRVDLAATGGHLIGVACWISHAAHQTPRTIDPTAVAELPRRPPRHSPVRDLLFRIQLLHAVMRLPHGEGQCHLACLATRPGYGTHAVADLLLHHAQHAARRHGHTLYTEVHRAADRDWLLRCGYRNVGASRDEHTDQPSYLMAHTGSAHPHDAARPTPPGPVDRIHASEPGS